MKEGGVQNAKLLSKVKNTHALLLALLLYCIPWKGAIALSYPLYCYCTAVFAGNDTFLNRKHHSR